MRAQALGLELHCALLLPALPELLPALPPIGLLVVGIAVSSTLRNLVLAIIELLPLAETRRSCGTRPPDCPGLGYARLHQCSRIANRLNAQDLNVEVRVLLEIGEFRHRTHRKPLQSHDVLLGQRGVHGQFALSIDVELASSTEHGTVRNIALRPLSQSVEIA